jgi:ribosome-associated protein
MLKSVYTITWRWYLDSLELAHLLVDSIIDKKGSNLVLLDLHEQAIFADYFLICNGENVRQLHALAQGIAEDAKHKASVLPLGVEGDAQSGWILLDFGDLVVHLFAPEKRAYYNLEDLWREAYPVLRMQ